MAGIPSAGRAWNGSAYGAYLHRLSGRPLLVTGGRPRQTVLSEAAAMKNTLDQEFGVAVCWLEERARNTRENATYSRETLAAEVNATSLANA